MNIIKAMTNKVIEEVCRAADVSRHALFIYQDGITIFLYMGLFRSRIDICLALPKLHLEWSMPDKILISDIDLCNPDAFAKLHDTIRDVVGSAWSIAYPLHPNRQGLTGLAAHSNTGR